MIKTSYKIYTYVKMIIFNEIDHVVLICEIESIYVFIHLDKNIILICTIFKRIILNKLLFSVII